MGDIYDNNAPDNDAYWEAWSRRKRELAKLRKELDPALVRYIDLLLETR